jgi:hypothetical protein
VAVGPAAAEVEREPGRLATVNPVIGCGECALIEPLAVGCHAAREGRVGAGDAWQHAAAVGEHSRPSS